MTNTATDRLRSLRVEDAMSHQPFAVRADQTLADAARFFGEHHITWAPVVDRQGVCMGVFGVADLLKKSKQKPADIAFTSEETVGQFATTRIFTTTPESLLMVAAATMVHNHVHRLPVVDHQGRLQGVLSTMDIVAALLNSVEEMDASLLSELRREN
jgi:CBS-domain-containing membrane protein